MRIESDRGWQVKGYLYHLNEKVEEYKDNEHVFEHTIHLCSVQ